jgi:hypothetical protein
MTCDDNGERRTVGDEFKGILSRILEGCQPLAGD